MNRLLNMRRGLSNKVVQPDYAGLTNVVFHGRYEGLVNNTNNTFGTVDVSGNVTKLKSVSPHATGVEFDSNGTAPTLATDGIQFGGAGRLRHGTIATFNNFHYRAALNDLKWTIHGVVKFGSSSDPNALYGLCGNNGTSSTSKGVAIYFDDRVSVPINNSLTIAITRGTASSFISLAQNTNIIKPNQFLDIWIECDKSDAQENEIRVYINGFKFIVSNRIDSSSPVTTPSFTMEIGGCGNGVGTAVMTVKELTFMDGVMSNAFRSTFITARMYKYGIAAYPQYVDGLLMTSNFDLTNSLSEGRYYLTNHLCQKPSDPNLIVSLFDDSTGHTALTGRVISKRVSTDKGVTWSSKSTVFDLGTTDRSIDPAAGYDASERLHIVTATQDSGTGVNKMWHCYSDDDGFSWSTPVEITSILPADGLDVFRSYSTIIENNGRLMLAMFKQNSGATSSARYLLYTDNPTSATPTWGYKTIQAAGATYRNESNIIALSSTVLLVVTRDESTFEWYQSMSTDNGNTWTNQGAVSFGESVDTYGAPARLRKFQISGTTVIACYLCDRVKDVFKAVYAKQSDLISSGISAWGVGTKFTIHQGSGVHLHYGDVCHYDNDFHALGMYVIDTYPIVGGTSNTMYTFNIPTSHYPFVKSALGI